MKLPYPLLLLSIILTAAISSCKDTKSYAELLNDENKAVNRFLVNQRVETSIPADSVFLAGPDAPYYQIDDEGCIYMQVLNPGSGPKVEDDQIVYFRFLRYNLSKYTNTISTLPYEGNLNNMGENPTSFRFNNYSLPSSAQWGAGLQMPLRFLPLNSEVNLVVKSQYGWTKEISYVIPYLYHICYYKSMI